MLKDFKHYLETAQTQTVKQDTRDPEDAAMVVVFNKDNPPTTITDITKTLEDFDVVQLQSDIASDGNLITYQLKLKPKR